MTLLLNRRQVATAAALTLATTALPLLAATPKDTLVVASAFDDIISLDPAEAFEISAGELMGNGYDRLLRYDVNDPSKLLPDLATKWSVSADGKPMTFTGVPQGGWIGEGSMLKTEARRYDIVAMRKSRIALMPRATFNWLLDTSIGFNRFLLEQINERLGQFLALIEFERLLKPDAKIARCIASLFNPVLYPSSGLQLKISQEEIGFLAGISRQRVNQALQVLAAEKLLRVEYGGITVLNLDGLKNY